MKQKEVLKSLVKWSFLTAICGCDSDLQVKTVGSEAVSCQASSQDSNETNSACNDPAYDQEKATIEEQITASMPQKTSAAEEVVFDMPDHPPIKAYKYKVGKEEDIDCQKEAGYSPAIPGSEIKKVDISSYPDGKIESCVLVKVEGEGWMTLEEALSHVWEKETKAPPEPSLPG